MACVPERVPDEDAALDELSAVEVRGQVARGRAEEDERQPQRQRDRSREGRLSARERA